MAPSYLLAHSFQSLQHLLEACATTVHTALTQGVELAHGTAASIVRTRHTLISVAHHTNATMATEVHLLSDQAVTMATVHHRTLAVHAALLVALPGTAKPSLVRGPRK